MSLSVHASLSQVSLVSTLLTRDPSVLTIDLRDAVGDRVYLSNDFSKDGVSQSFWIVVQR